jgi:hypothetical protein
MAEAVKSVDDEQQALDKRVESLLAAHNGDLRAVVETLLLAADSRAARASIGYDCGRLPAQ